MRSVGSKIDELNLKSMFVKAVTLWICYSMPLFGALTSSWDIAELRSALDQIEQELHANRIEMSLIHERLNEPKGPQPMASLEKRITLLEKNQEKIVGDVKKLKDQINTSFINYETRIAALETGISSELTSVKNSIASVVQLLKKESTQYYIVKPGDSLSQIALSHKISVKSLKDLNKITSDQIFVGQKLEIP